MKTYLGIAENLREDKIEKIPEFVQVVPGRRTILEDWPLFHDDLVRDTNVPFNWHDRIADNVGLAVLLPSEFYIWKQNKVSFIVFSKE